jgi:hypothetical protein
MGAEESKMSRIHVRVMMVALLVAGSSLFMATSQHVFASSRQFSGNFTQNDENGVYVDIPVTLQTDSVVFLDYQSGCILKEDATLYLFTPWSKQATFAKVSEIEQSYGPFPLVKGDYFVRLHCQRDKAGEQMASGYSVNVSSTPISTLYLQDQEPDANESDAIAITGDQSFDGWLGVGGYIGLKEDTWSDSGIDYSDIYYMNMEKGTKLQFKLEYDDNFTNNPFFGGSNGDIQLLIYYLKDGQTFFVHNFDIWTNSGDLSEQITLKEGGLFKVYVRGGYSSTLHKSNYGGYRLTILPQKGQ